jgi:hypothetical protein
LVFVYILKKNFLQGKSKLDFAKFLLQLFLP